MNITITRTDISDYVCAVLGRDQYDYDINAITTAIIERLDVTGEQDLSGTRGPYRIGDWLNGRITEVGFWSIVPDFEKTTVPTTSR